MKIEILHNSKDDIYEWKFYDGPDGIDFFEGIELDLGQCFERIIYHRTLNALNYTNDIVVKKETAQERGERVHNEMEETIKIHDGYGVVDYQPTPQTHEQVADGLKEAFREAQQTEKWKEIQNKIDGGDFDNFIEKTKLLDFLRDKLGYSTDSCYEIVDAISEWLPEEQIANSQNTYVELTVEGWNDCINFIRGKLQ